jgi:predicted transcriptional regulator
LDGLKQEKEDLEASLKEITEENLAIKTKLESYKQDMEGKLDRASEMNMRKVNDLIRLRQYFDRLRCDFFMLSSSRKIGEAHPDDMMMLEASNDSDRIVTDQISNTMEIITKIIDANV